MPLLSYSSQHQNQDASNNFAKCKKASFATCSQVTTMSTVRRRSLRLRNMASGQKMARMQAEPQLRGTKRLQDLPADVMLMILDLCALAHSDKLADGLVMQIGGELKNLSMTCRTFRQICVPLMFRAVHISDRKKEPHTILDAICQLEQSPHVLASARSVRGRRVGGPGGTIKAGVARN